MLAPKSRAKVSNGHLLPGIDGRSSAGRRFRDLVRSFESEFGGELSDVERALIRQAAALTMRGEQLQQDIVSGKDIDGDEIIRVSSEVRRILASVDKKAIKRGDSEPVAELQAYLAQTADNAS